MKYYSIIYALTSIPFFYSFLINNFLLFPFLFLIFFFSLITSLLYFSLWNIFKIFFFTEALLLIIVIFLAQYGSIFSIEFSLQYFYCQLILATAAAEAALFLGLFSHLYDQQFTNWIVNNKVQLKTPTYYTLLTALNSTKNNLSINSTDYIWHWYYDSLEEMRRENKNKL